MGCEPKGIVFDRETAERRVQEMIDRHCRTASQKVSGLVCGGTGGNPESDLPMLEGSLMSRQQFLHLRRLKYCSYLRELKAQNKSIVIITHNRRRPWPPGQHQQPRRENDYQPRIHQRGDRDSLIDDGREVTLRLRKARSVADSAAWAGYHP